MNKYISLPARRKILKFQEMLKKREEKIVEKRPYDIATNDMNISVIACLCIVLQVSFLADSNLTRYV